MHSFYDLVAGRGEPGFRDGIFTEAQFNNPLGLALNSDGSRLYVADGANNKIRMVLLDRANAVTTLAGTGEKADHDGSLLSAAFNNPRFVVCLPGNQLVVYESEESCLRDVDLNQNQVRTLISKDSPALKGLSFADCQAMVFDPGSQALYLSQPVHNGLWKVNLSQKDPSPTFLTCAPPLLKPYSLCLYQDRLCLSDQDSSQVFQAEFSSNSPTAQAIPVSLIAQGTKIKALAVSGDSLYALQDDPKPFLCLSSPRTADPPMIWDNPIHWGSANTVVNPFDWFNPSLGLCLIPSDAGHPGRFFLAVSARNELISFRDDGYQSLPVDNPDCLAGLIPYGHPAAKPPGAFRILIVADPHLNEPSSSSPIADPPLSPNLEMPISISTTTPQSTPAWEIPMVLSSVTPQPTPTPYPQVIPPSFSSTGPFPMFTLAQRVELVLNSRATLEDDPHSYEVMAIDPSLLNPSYLPALAAKYGIDSVIVMESTATRPQPPTEWLNQAESSFKTSALPGPPLEVCFLPGTGAVPEGSVEKDRAFWNQACMEKGLDLLDLTPSWTPLRCTYFPVAQTGAGGRLNVKGLSLLGWLLARELVFHNYFSLSEKNLPDPAPNPIRQYLDLAAGEGAPGYRDGNFSTAMLNGPGGMALGEDGATLYIADSQNHRIRALNLQAENQVETFAGSGEAAEKDGPLTVAAFQNPTLLTAIPKGLLVYEGSSGHMRFIDLESKTVSTWAIQEKNKPVNEGRLAGVFNMCYLPGNHCLYLTQPDLGLLEKISVDHPELTVEMSQDPRLLHPGALCLYQGSLCLADAQSSPVYKLGPGSNGKVSLDPLGKSDNTIALGAAQDRLYAISGPTPKWIRIFPPNPTCPFPFGMLIINPSHSTFPLSRARSPPACPSPGCWRTQRTKKDFFFPPPP